MKKTLTFILMMIFLFACKKKQEIYNTLENDDSYIEKDNKLNENKKDIIYWNAFELDSLRIYSNKELRFWTGSLQSLKKGQKKEIYVFGQCISGNRSFDILWVSNTSIDTLYTQNERDSYLQIYNSFKNGKKSHSYSKEGFRTFVFMLPLNDVDDPVIDDPYIFPCEVIVFHNEKDDLEIVYKGSYFIKDWEEYSQLRYNLIFTP